MSQPNFRRSLASNAVAAGAIPGATLLIAPAIARGLGAEGRGGVAAATALLVVLLALGSLGLPESSTYWIAKHTDRSLQIAARTLVLLLIVGSIISFALILLVGDISGKSSATRAAMLIAIYSLVPNLLSLGLRGIAAGLGYWNLPAIERYITAAVRLLGVYFLFFTGTITVLNTSIVLVFSSVAGALSYVHLFRTPSMQVRGDHLDFSEDRHEVQQNAGSKLGFGNQISYASRIWLGLAGAAVLSRVSQVIMPSLAPLDQLGIYVVAVNIADACIVVSIAIRDVVFAEATRDGSQNRVLRSARLAFALTAANGLLVGATAPVWLVPIFGEDFKEAYLPLIVLLATYTLGTPGSIAGAGLGALGRPGSRSIAVVAGAALNILLVAILAPSFGAFGAALATLAANLFCAVLVSKIYISRSNARWRDLYIPNRDDFREVGLLIWRVRRLVSPGRT